MVKTIGQRHGQTLCCHKFAEERNSSEHWLQVNFLQESYIGGMHPCILLECIIKALDVSNILSTPSDWHMEHGKVVSSLSSGSSLFGSLDFFFLGSDLYLSFLEVQHLSLLCSFN